VLTGKWSYNTGLEGTNGAWQDLVDSDELARNVAKRLEAIGYSCHLEDAEKVREEVLKVAKEAWPG
jgi:hypothetical protein